MFPDNSPLVAALVSDFSVPDTNVTFGFSRAGLRVDTGEPVGVVDSLSFSARETEFVRDVFDYISTVADLTFTEITNAGAATISFAKVGTFLSNTTGYSQGYTDGTSQIVIAAPYLGRNDTTVIHEIGHSLGLEHPHDGILFPGVTMPFDPGDLDLNNELTARMSYVPAAWPEAPELQIEGIGVSFGAVDIAALQSIYGANEATGQGDTTYGDVAGQQTIWDTGGTDTIDFSGAANDAVIDLRAATLLADEGGGGYYSYIGREDGTLATGGYTIAFGVEVENAVGGSGSDQLIGNAVSNTLIGGAGDDILSGGAQNDVLDGGAGRDTGIYSGNQSHYTLQLSAQRTVLEDRSGTDGTDTLVEMEALAFGDAAVAPFDLASFGGAAQLSEAQMKEVIELYIAYFNRAPDAIGLNFWGTAYANGTSRAQMAEFFIDQPEFRAAYPNTLSVDGFVSMIYTNVLGRAPDEEGFAFWVETLTSGARSRDQLILSVLDGAKVAPADADSDFLAQQQADQAYLSSKTDVGAYFAVIRGMSDTQNAAAAMALYDGTAQSTSDAVAAIDGYYADASDAASGEFLIQLVGVVDDPFGITV